MTLSQALCHFYMMVFYIQASTHMYPADWTHKLTRLLTRFTVPLTHKPTDTMRYMFECERDVFSQAN